MKRRDFIALLSSSMIARSVVGRAQQVAVPLVGYLNGGLRDPLAAYFEAFRNGLSETGFIDGRNVRVEDHWAEGNYDQMPQMAADLVRRSSAMLAR